MPFPSTFPATGSLEQVILQTNHEGHLAFKAYKWESSITIILVRPLRQTHACYLDANEITQQADRWNGFFLMYEPVK